MVSAPEEGRGSNKMEFNRMRGKEVEVPGDGDIIRSFGRRLGVRLTFSKR